MLRVSKLAAKRKHGTERIAEPVGDDEFRPYYDTSNHGNSNFSARGVPRFRPTYGAELGFVRRNTKFLPKKVSRGRITQPANDVLICENVWKLLCLFALESLLPLHSDRPFRELRIVFVRDHARLFE